MSRWEKNQKQQYLVRRNSDFGAHTYPELFTTGQDCVSAKAGLISCDRA